MTGHSRVQPSLLGEDLESGRNRAYRFSKEITMVVILQINQYSLISCIVIIL